MSMVRFKKTARKTPSTVVASVLGNAKEELLAKQAQIEKKVATIKGKQDELEKEKRSWDSSIAERKRFLETASKFISEETVRSAQSVLDIADDRVAQLAKAVEVVDAEQNKLQDALRGVKALLSKIEHNEFREHFHRERIAIPQAVETSTTDMQLEDFQRTIKVLTHSIDALTEMR